LRGGVPHSSDPKWALAVNPLRRESVNSDARRTPCCTQGRKESGGQNRGAGKLGENSASPQARSDQEYSDAGALHSWQWPTSSARKESRRVREEIQCAIVVEGRSFKSRIPLKEWISRLGSTGELARGSSADSRTGKACNRGLWRKGTPEVEISRERNKAYLHDGSAGRWYLKWIQ